MKVETGKARKPWPCDHTDCRKMIGPGEAYFLWHKNGDALRQHTSHGEPTKPATKKAAKKVTKKKAATKGTAKKKATKGGKK